MYRPNLNSVALPVPGIIATGDFGGVANLQSRERGSGMVSFERAFVSNYRPSSNFSSIFTRFRDIVAFVFQHATFPHPIFSPKLLHVPI